MHYTSCTGHLVDPGTAFPVPLVEATAGNLRGYARMFPATVDAYNKAGLAAWCSAPQELVIVKLHVVWVSG
jgi:hypothetical protein